MGAHDRSAPWQHRVGQRQSTASRNLASLRPCVALPNRAMPTPCSAQPCPSAALALHRSQRQSKASRHRAGAPHCVTITSRHDTQPRHAKAMPCISRAGPRRAPRVQASPTPFQAPHILAPAERYAANRCRRDAVLRVSSPLHHQATPHPGHAEPCCAMPDDAQPARCISRPFHGAAIPNHALATRS
jgi:hypothetical protein